MSQSGSVAEVLVQSRGSQLVGAHILGATTLLVDDPTPFDSDGGQILVDGTSYTFTAVTEVADTVDTAATNGQLTLSSGLVVAEDDLTPVDVWNGSQVLDDLILVVSTGEEADPPVPVILKAEQRAFWEGRLGPVEPPVAVVLSDDLSELLDAPGWTPSVNGAALVGLPDPAEIAVDPPTSSPAIISVTGNSTGLTVVTAPILPTTLVDFLVNGVVVAADQRTTVINLVDDGTNPLALDTDYTVTTQAHNSATDDDPTLLPAVSAGVTARLDPGMTATQVTAILQAGFILAGTIQVGSSMTLDGVGGITITQTDGRQTYLRADGSGNQFVGQAILDAATILGALTILGQTNFLNGLLTLGAGVSDPTGKPGVTAAGWDSVAPASAYGYTPRGLFSDSGNWLYTDSVFTSGNVNTINKATGVRTLLFNLPSGFNGIGGVVKIGASFYVLGKDSNRSANWYVYVFNASFVKTSEWAPTGFASGFECAIGVDGSSILITDRQPGSGNLFVHTWTTAGVNTAGLNVGASPAGFSPTGVLKVAVDTATVRYVVSSLTSGTRVFNTATGARVTGEEWTTTGARVCGLGSDGTNFFTLEGNGIASTTDHVWKYTNLIGTWDFAFDWADDDNTGASGAGTGLGGTNTARTRKSALKTTAPTKRAKWTISLPSVPPDDGTVDGANTANLYAVATGGTLVLQTSLAEGTYSATYSTLATSGTAPSTTNGFAARVGAIGNIISAALAQDSNPLVNLFGSGPQALGPYRCDANGIVSGGVGEFQLVQSSGVANPTSTANVTIPGFSLSLTSPGVGAVWKVTIEADVQISTGGTVNLVELLVDGSAQTVTMVTQVATATARIPGAKSWLVTGLSAGAHTITARTRNTAGATNATVQTNSQLMSERKM